MVSGEVRISTGEREPLLPKKGSREGLHSSSHSQRSVDVQREHALGSGSLSKASDSSLTGNNDGANAQSEPTQSKKPESRSQSSQRSNLSPHNDSSISGDDDWVQINASDVPMPENSKNVNGPVLLALDRRQTHDLPALIAEKRSKTIRSRMHNYVFGNGAQANLNQTEHQGAVQDLERTYREKIYAIRAEATKRVVEDNPEREDRMKNIQSEKDYNDLQRKEVGEKIEKEKDKEELEKLKERHEWYTKQTDQLDEKLSKLKAEKLAEIETLWKEGSSINSKAFETALAIQKDGHQSEVNAPGAASVASKFVPRLTIRAGRR